jgi:hypothetical protein
MGEVDMEALFVLGCFSLVGTIANIVNCLWEHDTHALAGWAVAFCGWFVALSQLAIRIFNKEK